jgi:hypothetical protein
MKWGHQDRYFNGTGKKNMTSEYTGDIPSRPLWLLASHLGHLGHLGQG